MTFRVLVVDNEDSFVYTLVDYLRQLGAQVEVRRSREVGEGGRGGDLASALRGRDAVLLSPGPGTPRDAGVSLPIVAEAAERAMPLLGVCLGHQAIAEAFGATVSIAPELLHGKTSEVCHDDSSLFSGLPNPFSATRYHSLAVVEETLPASLQVTARTLTGDIMALSHREAPLHGVQFHPESVLTVGGHRLLANWLARSGMPEALSAAVGKHPLVGPS